MTECILHSGGMFPSGYGAKWFEGATRRAHRVAYCVAHGIPWSAIEGQVVRHACDNKACVNPAHLSLGSHQDNMDDMKKRKRAAKGERNGVSKLTSADVAYIRSHYVWQSTEFGTVALGRMFGVTNSTIQRVITGKYWTA